MTIDPFSSATTIPCSDPASASERRLSESVLRATGTDRREKRCSVKGSAICLSSYPDSYQQQDDVSIQYNPDESSVGTMFARDRHARSPLVEHRVLLGLDHRPDLGSAR